MAPSAGLPDARLRPSEPLAFAPQASATPHSVSSSVCRDPHATCTTRTPPGADAAESTAAKEVELLVWPPYYQVALSSVNSRGKTLSFLYVAEILTPPR